MTLCASCSPSASVRALCVRRCPPMGASDCGRGLTWRTKRRWRGCSATTDCPVLLADVNVFIYAHRAESARHAEFAGWLHARLDGDEPFGVSELVLSAVVRIITNHRIFLDPTPTGVALDFCAGVLASPAAVVVRPGARHWGIFDSLCRQTSVRANVVPDAYLAALAIEHGATLATTDAAFRRFAGLRVEAPGQVAS